MINFDAEKVGGITFLKHRDKLYFYRHDAEASYYMTLETPVAHPDVCDEDRED